MAEVHAHGHAHSTGHGEPNHGAGGASGTEHGGTALKDPVCGMSVSRESPHRAQQGGDTHYFCSARCLSKFTADPARYANPHAGHRHDVLHAPSATAASTHFVKSGWPAA